jgi:hypothetical protein
MNRFALRRIDRGGRIETVRAGVQGYVRTRDLRAHDLGRVSDDLRDDVHQLGLVAPLGVLSERDVLSQ